MKRAPSAQTTSFCAALERGQTPAFEASLHAVGPRVRRRGQRAQRLAGFGGRPHCRPSPFLLCPLLSATPRPETLLRLQTEADKSRGVRPAEPRSVPTPVQPHQSGVPCMQSMDGSDSQRARPTQEPSKHPQDESISAASLKLLPEHLKKKKT